MRPQWLILLFAFVAAGLANLAGWALPNRPQDAGPGFDQPISSVSFAPFRRGQSPLTKTYPTAAQVESDLKLLSGKVHSVRTYTSREGMELVPQLAARYGLKVTHSAWLGTETDTNEKEITALIEQANAHPDVITRVLVGNEVLLRRDLKPDQLIGYIRRVKEAVRQPVSYADVWAFYIKHPQVAEAVDFLTIHILPYWEDEPQSIEDVSAHIVKIVRLMQARFPGKPILIGEAGWPTEGRSRGPAEPTVVNGARFLRSLMHTAQANNFDYNVVEAFDQEWKSRLEGTVGANWGIWNEARAMKFPTQGPVVEMPDWPRRFALSTLLAGLFLLMYRARLGDAAPIRVMGFAFYAQLLASLLLLAGGQAWSQSYFWWWEVLFGLRMALLALLTLTFLDAAARQMDGKLEGPLSSGLDEDLAQLRGVWPVLVMGLGGGATNPLDRQRWRGQALVLLLTAVALVHTALIVFDGRYRDFPVLPNLLLAAGIVGFASIRIFAGGYTALDAFSFGSLFGGRTQGEGACKAEKYALALFAFAVVGNIVAEGVALIGEDFTKDHPLLSDQIPLVFFGMFHNREVFVWSAIMAVLAIPFTLRFFAERKG